MPSSGNRPKNSSGEDDPTKMAALPYDPLTLGESLRQISSDVLKTEAHDLVSQWYQSPYDLNLFIWKDESGTIIRQQLSFFGMVADWNIVEGSKTGFIEEGERSSQVDSSAVIRLDKAPNLFILEQAKEITEKAAALSDLDRGQCSVNWRGGQVRALGTFEDFIQHYAKENSAKTTVWQRFRAWLKRLR